MIPDFFQTPDQLSQAVSLRTIIGLIIVIFATFVGVEIRVGNDEDD